jgi:hypothetical protein
MGNKSENLKNFKSWEKQNLDVFTKEGEPTIRMVTEWNHYYGELIVAFQFGEELSNTGVKCKYTGSLLLLQEPDSRCGERAFENGSITCEFLYKPLGLPFPEGDVHTKFDDIRDTLIKKGYKHTRKY